MSIYDSLNEMQREAVFHTEGPLLILAGAGSGKTRVLTHRAAYLIDECGVEPWNIMAITFTNKAAKEMRDRIDKLVGLGSESIWVSTFHSSCVRILRRHAELIGYDTGFTIYDTDDQKSIVKDACKRLDIDTKMLKERTIMNAISSAKDELIDPAAFEQQSFGDFNRQKIAKVYREYQAALKKNNAMDFDDLIMQTVELFRRSREVLENYQKRFQYIMVDEYQDTNTAQFELIRLLSAGSRNLCVVGDDDQSIYKFRGANIRNILDFEKYFSDAAVIKLEQNYRSTQNILDAANAVIQNNVGRKDKVLWTDAGAGNRVHFRQFDTAYEEAEYIASDISKRRREQGVRYDDCAVLYRTNAQSRLLEEQFIRSSIPYNVVGGVNFYSRKEIKDVLAYLKTIDNGADDLAVRRIINVPKRGIGATSISKVQDYAIANNMSFYDALSVADTIPSLGKAADKMKSFVYQIRVFRTRLKEEDYSLEDLVNDLLEVTDYIEYLRTDSAEDADEREQNIDELLSKVVAFEEENDEPTLSDFLADVALVADIDNLSDDTERVLLMTLHSAKGLEFENVYLAGMEDGIFPSYMTISSGDSMELEEERRLAYVGITRAKKDLTILAAKQRMVRGETQYNPVSRFVREIPAQLLDNTLPKNRMDLEHYEEDSQPRAVFKQKPYAQSSGSYVPYKPNPYTGGLKKPAKTPEYAKPYASKPSSPIAIHYQVGDRVKHFKFGEGIVKKMEPGPKDTKVTVDFDSGETKIMYAAFAKLQKV